MMLRALKGAAMVPAVRLGPPDGKMKLRFVDPEGGSRYQPQSGTRRWALARSASSGAYLAQAHKTIVPRFDLCPGCGRGKKVVSGG
jgi:hypothetical protein